MFLAQIQGKGRVALRIVTLYRLCRPTGPGLAYTQHQVQFDEIGRVECPRKALLDDLKEEMEKWREAGDQVIFMAHGRCQQIYPL
eukprot:11582105-Ditylum_brightwellii.AAC.1